jgi:hypothetical protein
MDLTEADIEVLAIHLAWDRVQRRALVDAVINIRLPQRVRNFLAS